MDIVNSVKKIAEQYKAGEISIDDINEDLISGSLSTNKIPDPDLMIRTSGEHRISNYLLWEMAYSEFYFTDVLWPDFRKNICTKRLQITKIEREDLEKQENKLVKLNNHTLPMSLKSLLLVSLFLLATNSLFAQLEKNDPIDIDYASPKEYVIVERKFAERLP